MGVCVCIWTYMFVPTSPSIYLPTCVFLSQKIQQESCLFVGILIALELRGRC